MGELRSELEVKRAALERRNTITTLVALAVWLGLSFLGEALFIEQNERLDAGAIFVIGGSLILIISALHLLFSRIFSRGLVIRSIVGIILLGKHNLGLSRGNGDGGDCCGDTLESIPAKVRPFLLH